MISSSHGPALRKVLLLILLLAAVGSAWLTTLVDGGLGLDWTQKVVRNWEQYGFFHLHGKLVENPGGFQVETHPKIYAGHRAVSLYPVFAIYHLFSPVGLGFLSYFALIAGIVMVAIWHLLGRTERAFWLAATVALAPGYVRWQTTLDPNLAVVLFGFPFCAAVLGLLRRPALQAFHWVALIVLIVAYSAVNWSTVFVHAMLFATLLVLPRMSWRRLFIYAGLTAAAAGAVLLMSVISKMHGAEGSSGGGGLATMLRGYGWGDVGYGAGLSTKTALLRLLAANLLGLLPVLIFLGWQFLRRGGPRSIPSWRFLLPALMPVIEILGMRNYFGHHPWMSVHYVLLGLVLAAVVWKQETAPVVAENSSSRWLWGKRLAGLAATFLYTFILLSVGRVHGAREVGLAALVFGHTSRDTTIVVARDTDQALAAMEGRLPELLDRHVVLLPSVDQASLAALSGNWVILTGDVPPAGKVFAQTADGEASSSVAKTLLGWYSRYIANRRPGDKLEVGDTYFLYQPPR